MNFSQHCLKIATLGKLGQVPGGTLIASSLVVVLMLAGKFLHWLSPTIAVWFFVSFILASIGIVIMALRAISTQDSSAIVLDELVGVSIMYAGLPLGVNYWKLYVFGFIFFHGLVFVLPRVLTGQRFSWLRDQGVVGVLASDILFGISLNGLLRLCIWWAY